MSRDPQHHPYPQGHHPLAWDVLRAISCFSELPCMDPSGCRWLGSLASTRGVVGYHHLRNTSSTDSGPSACLPWAQGPYTIAMTSRWPAGREPVLFHTTGSGQPGPLLQKLMLLWGGRVSWGLSTAHLTSPCPPREPGIAETWAQSEATATSVPSQPETPMQLLPTRLCPLSEQGSCLQKTALETIFRQSNTNGIWKPISSQFLPALKHLFFLFTLLALSKIEGGFLFLWKTERKPKIITVANSCNFSPTVLDVFLHPLLSFLLQCVMQKSQISFLKEKKNEQTVRGLPGSRKKLRSRNL